MDNEQEKTITGEEKGSNEIECTVCGKKFVGSFCPQCGAKATLLTECPVCHKKRVESEKFCSNCGYSFYQASNKQIKPSNVETIQKEKFNYFRLTSVFFSLMIVIIGLIMVFGNYISASFLGVQNKITLMSLLEDGKKDILLNDSEYNFAIIALFMVIIDVVISIFRLFCSGDFTKGTRIGDLLCSLLLLASNVVLFFDYKSFTSIKNDIDSEVNWLQFDSYINYTLIVSILLAIISIINMGIGNSQEQCENGKFLGNNTKQFFVNDSFYGWKDQMK